MDIISICCQNREEAYGGEIKQVKATHSLLDQRLLIAKTLIFDNLHNNFTFCLCVIYKPHANKTYFVKTLD